MNLAALGELGFGEGQGARNIVCISSGTGVGAGIFVGGALYRGHDQAAGEIGYLLPGAELLGRRYDGLALEILTSGSGIVERGRRAAPSLRKGWGLKTCSRRRAAVSPGPYVWWMRRSII